jgi:hypothetical protein
MVGASSPPACESMKNHPPRNATVEQLVISSTVGSDNNWLSRSVAEPFAGTSASTASQPVAHAVARGAPASIGRQSAYCGWTYRVVGFPSESKMNKSPSHSSMYPTARLIFPAFWIADPAVT